MQLFANPVKAKHAAKVGLAMVVAMGISLQVGWMNPYWAGFAVTFCSVATHGESLIKIVLRLSGTLIGVSAAFVILALFIQDRWLFLLALCIFLFIVTYRFTGNTKAQYMWQHAGTVVVIIAAGALGLSGDSNGIFQMGIARVIETSLGCIVWGLIDIFIWPVTNQGTLEKTAAQLTSLQRQLIECCRMASRPKGQAQEQEKEQEQGKEQQQPESFAALRSQQLKLIAKLDIELQAAGAESYAVREVRGVWQQLLADSRALLVVIDRWKVSIRELAGIDVQTVMPGSVSLLDDTEQRLEATERIWAGETVTPAGQPNDKKDLQVDQAALDKLRHMDRAAIIVTQRHLVEIAELVTELTRTAALLNDNANTAANSSSKEIAQQSRSLNITSPASLPFMFDPDRLRVCFYIVAVTCVPFVLWIYDNPPGGSSLWSMGVAFAFVAAGATHMRVGLGMLKAFGTYLPVAGLVYILVMPTLSGYWELSILIFAFIFWAQYQPANPLVTTGMMIGFLNMMPIANEQTYSFVSVAVTYLFLVMCLSIVVAGSYLLGSPRPEKMFMHLVKRYFRSARFVASTMTEPNAPQGGLLSRYRRAFHQRELATLPKKLMLWGSQISQQNFPANSPAQIAALVTGLDGLSYRLRELLALKDLPQAPYLVAELSEEMSNWRQVMQQAFTQISRGEAVDSAAALTDKLNMRLDRIEHSMDKALASAAEQVVDADVEHAYRLLGAYRGVASAATVWIADAQQVNWAHWREEVFS